MKIIRTILFMLSLILAVGLALTTLAGVVVPSRTVVPSLLAYGYLPLLAANVLMALVWGLMRRWEALLPVAVIALRWSMVGCFLQVGGTSKVPPREEHPQMVTLMTYNVHMFQGREMGLEQSDSNAAEFLTLVRQHRPDVLCLQEYAEPKHLALTDSLTLLGYNHYYGTSTSKGDRPRSTVVFSQLPITYVQRIDGTKLLVELMGDSQRLRVCCVHMDSYGFDDSDREEIARMRHGEVQQSSRRTMSKVKETILRHQTEWEQSLHPLVTGSTMPLVVAGDFNDIPSSWLYSQISKELRDCFRDQGFGYSYTYRDAHDHDRGNPQSWLPRFRIDMVFHNEGVQTLSYKRLKAEISDHYPVLVALEMGN